MEREREEKRERMRKRMKNGLQEDKWKREGGIGKRKVKNDAGKYKLQYYINKASKSKKAEIQTLTVVMYPQLEHSKHP